MKFIGVDPGLTKSGVCFFESKNDILLHSFEQYDLFCYLLSHKDCHIFVENSNLIKGTFHGSTSRANVGKNKAVSQLIVQFLKSQGFEYTELPPSGYSILAKKLKNIFEQESGWSGSSNEHERAAYYIGMAGMSRMSWETKLKQKR
jgi:hypothetical protein